MKHIKLKATQRIEIDFNIQEVTNQTEIPTDSKEFIKEYITSKKLADEYDKDLSLVFNDSIVFAFDYLHNEKKLLIPEVNPVLIFYSNAIMTHKNLYIFKNKLLESSQIVGQNWTNVNPTYFGDYFALASNCIINLQSATECFINHLIPHNYKYFSSNNREIKKPNIHDKIDIAMVDITNKNFEFEYGDDYILIKELVKLRNDIIHLKPINEETNTKYKNLFRRVIDYDFLNTTIAVKNYINFHSTNLIEECPCGKEFYYDIAMTKTIKNNVG